MNFNAFPPTKVLSSALIIVRETGQEFSFPAGSDNVSYDCLNADEQTPDGVVGVVHVLVCVVVLYM